MFLFVCVWYSGLCSLGCLRFLLFSSVLLLSIRSSTLQSCLLHKKKTRPRMPTPFGFAAYSTQKCLYNCQREKQTCFHLSMDSSHKFKCSAHVLCFKLLKLFMNFSIEQKKGYLAERPLFLAIKVEHHEFTLYDLYKTFKATWSLRVKNRLKFKGAVLPKVLLLFIHGHVIPLEWSTHLSKKPIYFMMLLIDHLPLHQRSEMDYKKLYGLPMPFYAIGTTFKEIFSYHKIISD